MLNADEIPRMLALVNHTLPENADLLVSARQKLVAGQSEFSEAERTVLDGVLQQVEYKGTANQVLVLLQQVNQMREHLQAEPAAAPATTKKPAAKKA